MTGHRECAARTTALDRPLVISLDIGGTAGDASGPTITQLLEALSPLPPREVRRALRGTLHVAPAFTDDVLTTVCKALRIEPASFPRDYTRTSLLLYPGVLDAIRSLSTVATVVSLSNVSCFDFAEDVMRACLGPNVTAHYPSCRSGYAKPDTRAFTAVAQRYGVPIGSLLHIGDDWECDVQGALSAGARAMWIARGRAIPNQGLGARSTHVTIVSDLAGAATYATRFAESAS